MSKTSANGPCPCVFAFILLKFSLFYLQVLTFCSTFLQQSFVGRPISTKLNEMESLKQCLTTCLQRANSKCSGFVGCERKSFLDVPISVKTFRENFSSKLPKLVMKENFMRASLTVKDLEFLLGEQMSPYIHPAACTQQRIVGKIKMFYRPKVKNMFTKTNCPRYILLCEYVQA